MEQNPSWQCLQSSAQHYSVMSGVYCIVWCVVYIYCLCSYPAVTILVAVSTCAAAAVFNLHLTQSCPAPAGLQICPAPTSAPSAAGRPDCWEVTGGECLPLQPVSPALLCHNSIGGQSSLAGPARPAQRIVNPASGSLSRSVIATLTPFWRQLAQFCCGIKVRNE